jgi:hypothetical protein
MEMRSRRLEIVGDGLVDADLLTDYSALSTTRRLRQTEASSCRRKRRVDVMLNEDPIFIHAWWRSGSTYIWLKLRENKSCRCYYEPLHERIADLNLAAIKAAPEIEFSRALRHPIPKKHYFAEYAKLLRSGSLHYFPELAYQRYLLLPGQADDRLRNYLDGLISSASAAKRRAILCFCRSQMRSAWMKQSCGGVHVAQIRNPADQWASFKIDSYFTFNMIMIALKLRDLHPHAFAHIEPFERFAQPLAKRRSLPKDLIAKIVSQFVSQRDCFDVFLVIWIASALQAIAYCDFLLDIDLLSTDLDYRNSASRWFDSISCSVDFSDCSSPTSSELHLRSPLFERTVEDAAGAIRSGASSLVITDPKAVEKWLPSLSPLSRWILRLALGAE